MILDVRTARMLAAAVAPKPSVWARIGQWLFGAGAPDKQLAAQPYKGAAPSRSKSDWTTTSAGPNTTLRAARPVLVARHRDLERNDPHIARAVSVYVHALVGTGLMATAKPPEDSDAGRALAADADRIYAAVCEPGVLDAMGLETGEALQAQEARAWLSGEVFIRRIWDRTAPVIPMRIQVLESDMLDETVTALGADGKNRIRQGIELNAMGRVVAYWLKAEHPGEASFGAVSAKSIRVPIEDCIHLKLPGRPGQLRSAPITAPVMATKKDLGDFESFTIIAKKAESLVVGVVTRRPYSEWNLPPEPGPPELDADGNELEPDVIVPGVVNLDGDYVGTMSPGQWLGVENGEDVRFNNPQLAANYDTFKKSHLQSVAAGLNLPYATLSGDFVNSNYSSMRGENLDFWAEIDAMLWLHFEPAQRRKWRWIMEAAWLAGLLPTPAIEADWQAPARPSIEPDKDALADYLLVRAGWKDEDDVIKALGNHPAKLRAKLEQNRKQREKHGIVSDADPTKYAWRGAFPPAAVGTPLEGELPPGSQARP